MQFADIHLLMAAERDDCDRFLARALGLFDTICLKAICGSCPRPWFSLPRVVTELLPSNWYRDFTAKGSAASLLHAQRLRPHLRLLRARDSEPGIRQRMRKQQG